MEGHEALERFERGGHGHAHGAENPLARSAAAAVAVLAAFLAIAAFLANEAVKEVITGETKAADANARLEANSVKTIIADANSTLLHVVGKGNAKEGRAAAKAEALEARIKEEFAPIDRRLSEQIATDHLERDRADEQHTLYEISEVGLQIGIVLASISILARRRWLLGGGIGIGMVGAGMLVAGLLY